MRYNLSLPIVFLLLFIPCRAFCLEVPLLKARVNDYAGILSPAMVQRLEEKLALLEKSDSTQVVILTVPSLQGEVIEDYSIKVAEAWKIGQESKDNGVILLVARNDRKVRIEVGRGLEGKLTDLISGRIIRNSIIPYFKQGDFDRGVSQGVDDIVRVVRGEYATDAASRENDHKFKPGIFFLLVVFAGPILFLPFLSSRSKFLGGVAGGIAGSALGYFWSSFLGLAIFGAIGFFIGRNINAASHVGSWRVSRGSPFGWGGFGGGNFGGGGGIFSSGGGFGGGGGGFGGGGSSGSW